ncbi:MAG: glycosyltransferase family 2 protein [Bacteroidetes bacterium]|nr:glycosyltransferase family 2 protein [Bacteroidota bacterium]
MELAPIVLFVYNRPWHTRQTLEALTKNDLADKSVLYIYADGPKIGSTNEDQKKIEDVRKIIREKKWCNEVVIIEEEQNKGLVHSVIEGVSQVVNRSEKIIVLEDDLVTSQGFLKYMNEVLNMYSDSQNIWSVTGYMFPLAYKTEPRTVVLPYISTWGWGTWKEKWISFVEAKHHYNLGKNPSLIKRFNLSDYDYSSMLKNNRQTSWGIRWYFHVFCFNGLSVFPTQSLLANIGKDGSGTNYTTIDNSLEPIICPTISVKKVESIDLLFLDKYLEYFTKKEPIKSGIFSKLKSLIKGKFIL